MDQPKKKGMPTWVVVLIVIAVASPFVIGIFAAFAIYGVRKYIKNAKRAEAVAMVDVWSKGMVACGEKEGSLPPSSPAVPSSLTAIAAMKYQSAPGEWSDPAFACAGFSMADPQYFQYQWVQESSAEGVIRALADLDGDGTAEEIVESRITCSGGRCGASTSNQRQ